MKQGREENQYGRMFWSRPLLRPLVLDPLELLRSFMTNGETVSMSGPREVTSPAFLPLAQARVHGVSVDVPILGSEKPWARKGEANNVGRGEGQSGHTWMKLVEVGLGLGAAVAGVRDGAARM